MIVTGMTYRHEMEYVRWLAEGDRSQPDAGRVERRHWLMDRLTRSSEGAR